MLLLPLLAACGDDTVTVTPASPSASAPSPSSGATSRAPLATASGVPTSEVDQTLTLTVAGGKVSGDTGRVKVALGSRVRIVVTSDVAEELHLHVYDLEKAVSPGQPAELLFTADVPGQIELELHGSGQVLTRLVIS